MTTYKITAGFWRATTLDGRYSNIQRRPDGWYADIRNERGELVRYAGIWRTLREAVGEVTAIFEACNTP